MNDNEFEQLRSKFYRSYANIPIPLRKEICAVVANEPMTFQVIKIELDNKTDMGRRAVEQMNSVGIL